MSELKEVSARLSIEVYVDCPKCGSLLDLMSQDDTDDYDHNEESFILKQACPSGRVYWSDAHKEFEVEDVTCSQCKESFNVRLLEW